jgi:hypothetical protein
MADDLRKIKAAIAALEAVEWIGGHNGWSAVCLWCRGYERHPAMDQDYYGKPGHKPTCKRQIALDGLRALLGETAAPETNK